MNKIKFSHRYFKMRDMDFNIVSTNLLQVLTAFKSDLSRDFIDYDTAYQGKDDVEYYELPEGKLIILVFQTATKVWTTMRRWTPQKMNQYCSLMGKQFEVIIYEM